jgi:hypothetical protein
MLQFLIDLGRNLDRPQARRVQRLLK